VAVLDRAAPVLEVAGELEVGDPLVEWVPEEGLEEGWEEVDGVEDGPEGVEDGLEEVVAGVEGVELGPEEVTLGLVSGPDEVGPLLVGPDAPEEVVKQLESGLPFTGKAPDWPGAPVLSRMLRPSWVGPRTFAFQV
jgi:hypothetical protein